MDLDDDELRATRILHGINDNLYDNATENKKKEIIRELKTARAVVIENNSSWDKIMTTERMTLEEAINIVDEMYQDRYKTIEEKTEEGTTIHLEKIDDVKFTNLEFASVRLLREVQSLQKKLESSTLEQKIEGEIQVHLNYLNNQATTSNPTLDKHFREKERYVIQVLRKLSEGENKNV